MVVCLILIFSMFSHTSLALPTVSATTLATPFSIFDRRASDHLEATDSNSTLHVKHTLPLPAIIGGVTAGIIIAVATVLYLCCWRPRQKRRQASEPAFDLLYNQRCASRESDKWFVQIELDTDHTRPTTPAQQYEQNDTSSVVEKEEIYELDGNAIEIGSSSQETERRSWFDGVKRLSQLFSGSSPTITITSPVKPNSSFALRSNQYTPIPVVRLAPAKVSNTDLQPSDAVYRDRSPSPSWTGDQRLGRQPLRHEYRVISRSPTVSPARSITSTWNSLRVPVSPVSSCSDEEGAIACKCPAHLQMGKS